MPHPDPLPHDEDYVPRDDGLTRSPSSGDSLADAFSDLVGKLLTDSVPLEIVRRRLSARYGCPVTTTIERTRYDTTFRVVRIEFQGVVEDLYEVEQALSRLVPRGCRLALFGEARRPRTCWERISEAEDYL